MSVHWPILRQLIFFPNRISVIDDQKTWRGYELLIGALHISKVIEKVSNSGKVGIMLPTSGLFPISALGSWILGKTIVPLNYLLKNEDLQYVCDDSGIDTIITVKPMLEFVGKVPTGSTIICLEDLNFKQIPEPRWPKLACDNDLATILYTSGTSGKPKGVMLTHGNLSSNIQQVIEWADFSSQDFLIGVLPQFHSFGHTVLTLLPLTIGAKVCYTARFLPKKIIQLIKKHRPTAMIAIPSMYNALLNVKDADKDVFKCMRYVVAGGEPLPDAVAEAFEGKYGVRINEGYGLTETSPASHWCRPHEFRKHSVGRAIPRVKVRIVDDKEQDLGINTDGEVRLSGPNIMQGYYNLVEETAKVFDKRGYFKTGDMGRVDADGFLYITGRIKEMMIIAGENVFPREIEEVINKYPDIQDSAVIGIVDESRGEIPVGFVEMREGAKFNETAIRAYCREHLAQYKVPREIYNVPEGLPRNPTGKILRRELKAKYPATVSK